MVIIGNIEQPSLIATALSRIAYYAESAGDFAHHRGGGILRDGLVKPSLYLLASAAILAIISCLSPPSWAGVGTKDCVVEISGLSNQNALNPIENYSEILNLSFAGSLSGELVCDDFRYKLRIQFIGRADSQGRSHFRKLITDGYQIFDRGIWSVFFFPIKEDRLPGRHRASMNLCKTATSSIVTEPTAFVEEKFATYLVLDCKNDQFIAAETWVTEDLSGNYVCSITIYGQDYTMSFSLRDQAVCTLRNTPKTIDAVVDLIEALQFG